MFISDELKKEIIKLGNELCSIIQDNDDCELQMTEEFSGKFWIHNEDYETEFRFNLFFFLGWQYPLIYYGDKPPFFCKNLKIAVIDYTKDNILYMYFQSEKMQYFKRI